MLHLARFFCCRMLQLFLFFGVGCCNLSSSSFFLYLQDVATCPFFCCRFLHFLFFFGRMLQLVFFFSFVVVGCCNLPVFFCCRMLQLFFVGRMLQLFFGMGVPC